MGVGASASCLSPHVSWGPLLSWRPHLSHRNGHTSLLWHVSAFMEVASNLHWVWCHGFTLPKSSTWQRKSRRSRSLCSATTCSTHSLSTSPQSPWHGAHQELSTCLGSQMCCAGSLSSFGSERRRVSRSRTCQLCSVVRALIPSAVRRRKIRVTRT